MGALIAPFGGRFPAAAALSPSMQVRQVAHTLEVELARRCHDAEEDLGIFDRGRPGLRDAITLAGGASRDARCVAACDAGGCTRCGYARRETGSGRRDWGLGLRGVRISEGREACRGPRGAEIPEAAGVSVAESLPERGESKGGRLCVRKSSAGTWAFHNAAQRFTKTWQYGAAFSIARVQSPVMVDRTADRIVVDAECSRRQRENARNRPHHPPPHLQQSPTPTPTLGSPSRPGQPTGSRTEATSEHHTTRGVRPV